MAHAASQRHDRDCDSGCRRRGPRRSPFREVETRIKTLQEEKESAVAGQDFEKAIRLRDQEHELRKSLPERPWTIELEHVLLEMLRFPDCEAARIVQAAGTTPEAVRAALLEEMQARGSPHPNPLPMGEGTSAGCGRQASAASSSATYSPIS